MERVCDNAASADGEYEGKMDALLCRLTNGKWSKSRVYDLDFMVSCVDEAYEEAYAKDAELNRAECDWVLEYDREEVERRRRLYEEDPHGLFPQDMPEDKWTCSNCGKQFKCHYDRQTGAVKPIPDWIKHCPSCGARIRKAVER